VIAMSSGEPPPSPSGREGTRLFRRLVLVALFLEIGLLLVVLPWSGFWDRNYFGAALPGLRPIITNNFVRGAVTGLGLVNLLAGAIELMLLFAGRGRHHAP
jgi:hypothetical protein